MTDSTVFDRRAVRLHRERAAVGFAGFGFLKREVAARLAERLLDIDRRFAVAVELGAHDGLLREALPADRIGWLAQTDLSPAMARLCAARGPAAAADEEALPFAGASLDAVLSCLSLHWVNDLPGTLAQIRRALRPDGLLLAAMLGAGTLVELRAALADAEVEVTGGLSPRVSPFADLRDAAGLLQRAGFALPVADGDSITVTWENAFALMRDLRGMAEANAVAERLRRPTRRAVLLRAAELYQQRHADVDGRIPATFQIVWLAGWAPHADQQRPLRPGSAATRLADALGTVERGSGEAPDS
jgi:NADH dehydrogenase [ubiquinone] 1 alpha subcomplex assembly factor 5